MKVLFLGIDSLDWNLLEQFMDQLPNFARFKEQAKSLRVISTFPPDSDTAWATISTGLNPAQHGIVKFVDPLEKSRRIMSQEDSNRILHGKTFWDLLGQAGYKTYAIFPHLGYPIWQTPAVMVSRGKIAADVQSTSPEILNKYPDLDLLPGIRGFPERSYAGMNDYYQKLSLLAESDAEFALRLLKEKDWDIFFVYWSTIDAIGHFFWNTFDQSDPFYTKDNPFRDVIQETYRLYDRILGRFLDSIQEDVTVIVLSDHGHGARPNQVVNINEILRQGGYLKTIDTRRNPHKQLFEQGKRVVIRFVSKYGLARIAGKIMHHVPAVVEAFTRPSMVNWDDTIAYATDMSGIKAYTYGGVVINNDHLGERDYEQVRSEIIALLREKSVLEDGQLLLKFIARREDIYQGPYLASYPDILLEYLYGYGVGWAVNSPLITQTVSYNLVPGSHRGETGVCMIRSARKIERNQIDLLDIMPSLLDLFKVPVPGQYDGKSIFDR